MKIIRLYVIELLDVMYEQTVIMKKAFVVLTLVTCVAHVVAPRDIWD